MAGSRRSGSHGHHNEPYFVRKFRRKERITCAVMVLLSILVGGLVVLALFPELQPDFLKNLLH